ncbi:Chaperone protein dnak [Thalictrum thalictroides]|uniref:Chaperone protein dnak n=1 Tax=Thalictrum thalictroides TaxID=46969 RepID=A0A7J6VDD5_THATH|nr:Chaperone protein dnak [Thalictrum thalictroides]
MATPFFSKPVGNQYIAIDFGTTCTRVAVIEGNTMKVIKNFPSLVFIAGNNCELIIGTPAKEMAVTNPKRVYEIKRLLGRRFDDPDTQKEMKILPYKMVKGPNGQAWVEANRRAHDPTAIVAAIFVRLKKDAEMYLGKSVSSDLITYPSEWHAEQCGALWQAGLLAGLNEQGAIVATMAAAFSHDLVKTEGRILAVVIFGGRTCDVSMLRVIIGKYVHMASRHDACLGGNDFDNVIVEFLVDEFKRSDAVDRTKPQMTS